MPSTTDVRTWYNRHYAARGVAGMRPPAAYPLILDLLDARPGMTLLDVSSGPGLLLAAATARGLRAVGVDLSDQAARIAHQAAPAARIAVGPGEQLCFRDRTFDCVTCLGSLEHFTDMRLGLREMQRVAKPGAQFCIMVPNAHFIGWRVLGHRGTSQQDINEELLGLREWRALFEREGFAIERVVADRWHAVKWRYPGRADVGKRILGMVLEPVWRLIPLRWQYQFVFLLRTRNTLATAR